MSPDLCGPPDFVLYILDADGVLVPHERFRVWEDVIDAAIDANLGADEMCVVQRNDVGSKVLAIQKHLIPPVEVGMKPACR